MWAELLPHTDPLAVLIRGQENNTSKPHPPSNRHHDNQLRQVYIHPQACNSSFLNTAKSTAPASTSVSGDTYWGTLAYNPNDTPAANKGYMPNSMAGGTSLQKRNPIYL